LLFLNKPILTNIEKQKLRKLTNNLVRFDSINWKQACAWMKKNIGEKDQTQKVNIQWDKVGIEIIKPRTKADLVVRRLRLLDIIRECDRELKEEMKYYTHLDTIFITNIAIYGLIHGYETIRTLRKLGLFNDYQSYMDKASKISTHFKRYPICKDETKQRLCEIGTLIGYLQNDTDSWNTEKELEGLAQGGNEHGLIGENWEERFQKLLQDIQVPITPKEFISFEEYVKSPLWITAGSSSIGQVEWSYDQDSGRFKARKNMIYDVISPDDLWEIVGKWNGSLVSRAFIKDEMGKRRLAVSSNIESYLHESYLLYLYGHGFKNFKGITLDETPRQTQLRNLDVMDKLRSGLYALPFDYARFDHQPKTKEVTDIIQDIATKVKGVIPGPYVNEFDRIVTKIVRSYNNSTISMTIGQEKRKLDVEGGIPSGVRTTSLIGNIWNSLMTEDATQIVTIILGYNPIKALGIKGDDTYTLANTAVELFMMRLAYAAINAQGLDSKFGISQRVCEFLRNEITSESVTGWANRAIPSLSQRKPWNAQPWSPNSDVSTIANNIYLLERRLNRKIDKLHDANKHRWSGITRQSNNWLHLPIRLGGFGVYPYNGWVPNCKLPLVTKPIMDITNITSLPKFEQLTWINLNEQQMHDYHLAKMTNKIAADDIPGPQKHYSYDFILSMRKLKPTWNKEEVVLKSLPQISIRQDYPLRNEHIKYIESNDPRVPPLHRFLREYNEVELTKRKNKTIELPSLMTYLKQYFGAIADKVKNLEQKGWHRTDAISIATGEVPIEQTSYIHPQLTQIVKDMIKDSNIMYIKGRKRIAKTLSKYTYDASTIVLQSPISAIFRY